MRLLAKLFENSSSPESTHLKLLEMGSEFAEADDFLDDMIHEQSAQPLDDNKLEEQKKLHQIDPDEDEFFDAAKPNIDDESAQSSPNITDGHSILINQMVEMGYEKEFAKTALEASHYQLEEAIMYIEEQQRALEGADSSRSVPALPPRSQSKLGSDLSSQFNKFTLNTENFFKQVSHKYQEKLGQLAKSPDQNSSFDVLNQYTEPCIVGDNVLMIKALNLKPDQLIPNPFHQSDTDITEFRSKFLSGIDEPSPNLIGQYYLEECSRRKCSALERVLISLERASKFNGGTDKLVSLNLDRCTFTADSMRVLADLILCFSNSLKSISIRFTNLNDETLIILLRALLLADKIPWLCISNNRAISFKGLKLISAFVQKSTRLKFIDMGGIRFDFSAASSLAVALAKAENGVEVLKLDNSGLSGLVLEEFCERYQTAINSLALGSGGSLKALSLRHNKLQAQHMKSLCCLLTSKLNGISRLDLTGNKIESRGLEILLTHLQNTKDYRILELNLADNMIDHSALQIIGNFLSSNNTLKFLDLSHNMGVCKHNSNLQYLAWGLTTNSTLATLILTHTGLDLAGIQVIAEALVENSGLAKLDIGGNELEYVVSELFGFSSTAVGKWARAVFGSDKAIAATSESFKKAFKVLKDGVNSPKSPLGSPEYNSPPVAGAPRLPPRDPTPKSRAISSLIALRASIKTNSNLALKELRLFDEEALRKRLDAMRIERITSQTSETGQMSTDSVNARLLADQQLVLNCLDEIDSICGADGIAVKDTAVMNEGNSPHYKSDHEESPRENAISAPTFALDDEEESNSEVD